MTENERASRQAREALLEAKTKGRAKSSLAKVCSWMERDGSNWYDSIGDPSAGDFCGVLRALDGEIAVLLEFDGEARPDSIIWYDGGYRSARVDLQRGEYDVVYLLNVADSVRLLHRDDTQELPGAVQEAMEGEQ